MPSNEMIGADPSGQARPMRRCGGLGIGCGQVDDHPRHVIDVPGEDDVAFHLDCHAAAGCRSCAEQVQGSDGATGAELLNHIIETGS